MSGGAARDRRAFVLGGGTAGLTAAFGLADRGYRVVLLESRGWLGGRAFASRDAATGRELDNGPHVMLGCYRAMRTLLRRLGTETLFLQGRRLELAYRPAGGAPKRLALAPWPVPLAMPLGLLRLGLPGGGTLRALRGMAGVLRGAPSSWSLAEWLRRRGQSGAPEVFLWRPLCVAIMNVEPAAASAADFLATLRQAFLGSASSAAFWVPLRPWSEILAAPAPKALAAAGVDVRFGARVTALATTGASSPRVAAIELGAGERIDVQAGDVVVSALPWFALRTLVPAVGAAGSLRSSPIVSVYVETAPAAAVLPDDGPVTALVGGDPFHFVLRTPGADARRFALLSGGCRALDGLGVDGIAAAALAQLPRHYAGFSCEGAVVRVRKEQHATFIAAPETSAHRPAPGPLRGGPENLLVCGDWTATGLPATLEGAARSAEAMLGRLGGR